MLSDATRFELVLFSTDPGFIRFAAAAGVDSMIVDWEWMGKAERQAGADTQINCDTVEDLRRVRACTAARVLCRINNHPRATPLEVEQAIDAGADEILLPMVRSVREVETVLAQVDGRCGVGILAETVAAMDAADPLTALPLSRIYVGLNDLAIERRSANLFEALRDGTVDLLRQRCTMPFGVAGLTLPDLGMPVPCRLLIGELARLRAEFSFLRRSFHRDIRGRDMALEIPRLRAALEAAWARAPQRVASDREELDRAIALLGGCPAETHAVHA